MEGIIAILSTVGLFGTIIFGILYFNKRKKDKETAKKYAKFTAITAVAFIASAVLTAVTTSPEELKAREAERQEKRELAQAEKEADKAREAEEEAIKQAQADADKKEKEAVGSDEGSAKEPVEETTAPPATLDDAIHADFEKILGEKTNTGEQKVIELKINDHYGVDVEGAKLIIAQLRANEVVTSKSTKGKMLLEAEELLPKLFEYDEIHEVTLNWMMPLQDSKGNVELGQVMRINLTRETAKSINWKNFDRHKFNTVADMYIEHPGFSK